MLGNPLKQIKKHRIARQQIQHDASSPRIHRTGLSTPIPNLASTENPLLQIAHFPLLPGSPCTASRQRTVVPTLTSDSSSTVPPSAATACFTIASPSPVPRSAPPRERFTV